MDSKRLVVIDGYSLLYRAFFATRYLSTSDGRPTNALFGFVSMLFNILEKQKPHAIVVALDAPGKTFRHAEFESYKATRRETQDELKVQLKEARKLINTLGIPTVEVIGFEADDVVGTISKLAEENGYHATILTGDLDALQLVDACVSVMTMKIGVSDTITYGPQEVIDRYGFGPEFIPDFKALKGDTSDNIPGVAGIGDKSGSELIVRFGTIESIIENMAEVEPKHRKKLEGNEAQMLQSKYLATIVRDVELVYDFKPFVLNANQMEAAVALMENYEFRQHVRRAPVVLGMYLDGRSPSLSDKPVVVSDEDLLVINQKVENFDELLAFVGEHPYSVFFSTTGEQTDLFEEPVRKAFIAVAKDVREASESDGLRLIEAKPGLAILHDAKPAFKKVGAALSQPHFDSFLAAFVLRSERSNYPLRDLVQGYLDFAPPETPEQMAAALHLLEAPLRERLGKEDQTRVLEEIEMPLIPILAEMEKLGIKASREGLAQFSRELQKTIEETTATVHELCGEEFNIGSPKQLGFILFEKMQIQGGQKTKTGWATGVEVLGELAASHDVCVKVLQWRELSKLKSTYADALQGLIKADGRLHTTYSQTGAATGRLSSNDPNLQNIPIRTELGRGIRKSFHADDGYLLLSLDYSQIELRILAHMCGEPALVQAFLRREDVHAVTAKLMFNLAEEPPSKEQRRLAKMLNFAVLYGVSEYGLAQQLGTGFGFAEAKELIRVYNERFPTVKNFTDSIVVEARSKGFTTTLYGRRRYFPEIHAPKIMDRKAAERQAVNAPIQGTAADMMKLAMIAANQVLQGRRTRMLLTVHDELLFEMAVGEESILEELRSSMEQALPLRVPVEVDAKVGPTWDDMMVVPKSASPVADAFMGHE